MEGSGSSGFDISRMSTAEKLLAGGGILLLIDSFLPWQRVCVDLGSIGGGPVCAGASMWSGSGAFAGVIAGLLTIALIVVGILSMSGAMANMNMGAMSADKLVGFLGAGVFVFGILKFIFAITNSPGYGAFIGLVLLLAIGYGAWQKIQSSGGFSMGGASGGSSMGGGMDGGSMGGGMGGGTTPPPPSAPPPSTPPPAVPPGGSSDM
jgi:hypothetical protein